MAKEDEQEANDLLQDTYTLLDAMEDAWEKENPLESFPGTDKRVLVTEYGPAYLNVESLDGDWLTFTDGTRMRCDKVFCGATEQAWWLPLAERVKAFCEKA